MKPGSEKNLFLVALSLIGLIYLALIWFTKYLPMQDLPQHLFQSLVYSLKDTDHRWNQIYTANVVLGPYSLFYYLTSFSYSLFGSMLTAGKIFVSLALVFQYFLALSVFDITKKHQTPWPLLLVFPIFFNQTYFLGFTNYIVSVPTALFLLSEYLHFTVRRENPSLLRHALILFAHLVLFMSHPYSLGLYLFFTLLLVLWSLKNRQSLSYLYFYPLISLVYFGVWFSLRESFPSSSHGFLSLFSWWPLKTTLLHFALFFTGMKVTGNIDFLNLGLWLVSLGVPLAFLLKNKEKKSLYFTAFLLCFVFCLLLYLFLPTFVRPSYSYFNARMAPFVYLSFVMLLSQVKIPRFFSFLIFLCSLGFLYSNFSLHRKISKEISEVEQVFKALSKNALFLPLSYSNRSKHLDPYFYYETHKHVHYYHHVLNKDGFSFSLFQNPLQAVQIRKNISLPPSPQRAQYFSWEQHSKFYPFILVRFPTQEFMRKKPDHFKHIGQSGPWSLFKKTD